MTSHIAPLHQDPRTQALAVRNLHKAFDGVTAVHDLSLDIPRGSFFGIVGPNGAGKTTTLSMATGLLRPDYGYAFCLGNDVWADPSLAKTHMGILADGLALFDRLSGLELLQYVGMLRGLRGADLTTRSNDLLQALDLSGAGGKMVADYSAGMTKKITLACALIHAPKVLLLDEPFEAVDPVSGEIIKTILRQFVANGGTVVLSSHVMELVEGLCSHVAVIAAGQVLASGTLDEVRGGDSLVNTFMHLVGPRNVSEGSLQWLQS